MQRGPKGDANLSPLPFRSTLSGARRFARWCEKYLIVPKGKGAGQPMRIRPWQIDMLRPFLDPDPDPRPSV
jgi:hypothetical protein